MFCKCGKLMTKTDIGYECICGRCKDNFGNELSDSEVLSAEEEASRIAEIKKKYRYRYPNINDPLVRITRPVEEDDSCDETFSSLTPKEIEKRRKKKIKFK
ncbi:MAG: hypothetical protein J6D42_04625 [Clostridia bacterium]|nr:hypothetical protein [Clostridia bacterium]